MEHRLRDRILLAITLLLAGLFVFLMAYQLRQERRQSEQLAQFYAQTSAYENELRSIRAELHEMKLAIDQVDITPETALCFLVRDPAQIQWVEDTFSSYGWPVSIVIPIDQTNGADIIARMAQSQMDMEVMFAGISLYQQHQANLEQMKQQAQRLEVAVSPMWFLSQEEHTQDNLNLLKQYGITGYTQPSQYSDVIQSGNSKDDQLYVEHVPIKPGERILGSGLELAVRQKRFLICAFDVEQMDGSPEAQVTLDNALKVLTQFQNDGDILVDSTRHFFDLKEEQRKAIEQRREEYNRYSAQQQQRIQQLEDNIDQLYEEWNMER